MPLAKSKEEMTVIQNAAREQNTDGVCSYLWHPVSDLYSLGIYTDSYCSYKKSFKDRKCLNVRQKLRTREITKSTLKI